MDQNWSAQFHFEGISTTGGDLLDHVSCYSDFDYIMGMIVKKMLRCEEKRKKISVTLEVLFEVDSLDMVMFHRKYLPFLNNEKKEVYFACFMSFMANQKIPYFTDQHRKDEEKKNEKKCDKQG